MFCPSRRAAAVFVALAALALSACGATGDQEPAAAPTGAPERTSSVSPHGGEPFPITIAHKFGSTEVAAPPERVVTVGLTDHDAFLALDVVPVGVVDWYGEQPDALWPWAREALGGQAPPAIVGNAQELDFEAIAALEPDLIVGLYSALTEDVYDTLSQIAPTVAQPAEHADWSIPWQQLTTTVGRIVGKTAQAEELVADIEDRFAAVRDSHPEFEGATALIATPYEGIYVYSPDVANVRLLRNLGFEVPTEIAELAGDQPGTEVSLEQAELLDVDVLVWLDAQPGQGPLAEPVYRQLDVHTEGREVLISSASDVGGAMSFSSVLSLPYLLDELVPRLEAALDGDPTTSPEPIEGDAA